MQKIHLKFHEKSPGIYWTFVKLSSWTRRRLVVINYLKYSVVEMEYCTGIEYLRVMSALFNQWEALKLGFIRVEEASFRYKFSNDMQQ